MLLPSSLHEVLRAVSWPMVALVAVVAFRYELRHLLRRLREAKFLGDSGPSLAFGESAADRPMQSPAPLIAPAAPGVDSSGLPLDKTKHANLYWLAHDMMSLFDGLLRGADRGTVVHLLRQSNHHLKTVGFTGTPMQLRLERMYRVADESLASDWSKEKRIEYAQEILSMSRDFGHLIEATQPGFQGFPKAGDA